MRDHCGSRRFLHMTALLLILLLSAGVAAAGPRDHQDGFFLRLSAGGGSFSTSIDDGTDEAEVSGSIGDANIAIGAIIAPNLALHGTLMGWSAQDPDLTSTGRPSGKSTAKSRPGGSAPG